MQEIHSCTIKNIKHFLTKVSGYFRKKTQEESISQILDEPRTHQIQTSFGDFGFKSLSFSSFMRTTMSKSGIIRANIILTFHLSENLQNENSGSNAKSPKDAKAPRTSTFILNMYKEIIL